MKTISYIFIMFLIFVVFSMYYFKMFRIPAMNHAELNFIYTVVGASIIIGIFLVAFHFVMKK